jgi:antitoxin StbD
MDTILSKYTASITELKRNPNAILQEADGETVAILNHNKPLAYLIPAQQYQLLLSVLEDKALNEIAEQRIHDGSDLIKIDLDEL